MSINTEDRQFKVVTPSLIRTIRKALGLSQEQMANLIGVTRQMVNYYERGDAYPSIETWVKWTDAVEKQIKKLKKHEAREAKPSPTIENEDTQNTDLG